MAVYFPVWFSSTFEQVHYLGFPLKTAARAQGPKYQSPNSINIEMILLPWTGHWHWNIYTNTVTGNMQLNQNNAQKKCNAVATNCKGRPHLAHFLIRYITRIREGNVIPKETDIISGRPPAGRGRTIRSISWLKMNQLNYEDCTWRRFLGTNHVLLHSPGRTERLKGLAVDLL